MSAIVQELKVSAKLKEVYRYMVVIRWAHLIIRLRTKEIEREFYDAYERLHKVLLRVHSRAECINLDLDTSPLGHLKLGVESVVKLLRTILEGFHQQETHSLDRFIGVTLLRSVSRWSD
ncbi:hypothetical protein Bca52824_025053 [Brassica carinata]|uniref:Uncharacterized protein n=1 Tax=Brassica carinata TaxID=52824 RepID=A0A8X7VLI6_BRACI|nr:hypothetical protein Bca52824_025053 [Brassica carinata]